MPLNTKYFVLSAALAATLLPAQIRRVQVFREDARNPAWSSTGRILFERAGEVLLAGANPSADRVLVKAPNFGAEWHPSGRFFAYSGVAAIRFIDPDTQRTLDTFPAVAARDLRFSRDGAQLAWFESGRGRIRRGNATVTLNLPEGLVLIGIDDFTFEGNELLVTGHSATAADPRETQIYACGVAKAACRAITTKPGQRHDFARLSPSGRNLVFASSETAWVPDAAIDYESDFWIQNFDAPESAHRMTWFGEPANPRYDPEHARVNAATWSKDGRYLLATITEGPHQDRSHIVKIEFPIGAASAVVGEAIVAQSLSSWLFQRQDSGAG